MSRIEGLPDDFDKSLSISDSPSTKLPDSAGSTSQPSVPFPLPPKSKDEEVTLPAIPPQMESVRAHTAEEIVQMINKAPLFMTSLDDAGNEDDNVELEAMRALQYEGTRAEIAQNFREQGNEMARAKRWKDGKEYYTKGLAALKQPQSAPPLTEDGEPLPTQNLDSETEAKKEKEIEEACFINRALCNLELQNYRSTIHDCASTLHLNPTNLKAFYRSTLALLALHKLPEARDACTHGLRLSPHEPSLLTLSQKLTTAETAASAAATKQKAALERAAKEHLLLATALKARGIRIRTTKQPPDLEDARIHLSPDPLAPTSQVVYPLLLLYPLAAQSDFVKACGESDTLQQHLEYVFPLPWDGEGLYTAGGVECFMETGAGGMVKVGRKVAVGDCLGEGQGKAGGEVVDGVVRVMVVPKGKVRGWVEEMRKRKGR
ncbi:MAG: hypothetical protein HETSPECPRED_008677 [Heterodermia speciosa]|uniref:Cns1/TTC4 wheel domain-containing protein n=1 Tax=Heterodermia speciosa TaxID=116794 RepID=A0A8H3FZH9_9LECA|nr:MAG: hypothetical protein HETSPECPRED_008677 [Heterodermia speciosa]